MTEEGKDVRQRVLEAAVELLRDTQDAEAVSIRAIAARAGVSVGMANYHFQTKDHLIELAVQTYIAGVISGEDPDAPPDAGPEAGAGSADPADSMRTRLRAAARFVARHPGISRVSIIRDIKAGHAGDNSDAIAAGVYRQLRAVVGDAVDEETLRLRAEMQVAAVQHLFMRAAVIRETTGLDFFDDAQRDRMMDGIVDAVLGGLPAGE